MNKSKIPAVAIFSVFLAFAVMAVLFMPGFSADVYQAQANVSSKNVAAEGGTGERAKTVAEKKRDKNRFLRARKANQRKLDRFDARQQRKAKASSSILAEVKRNQAYSRKAKPRGRQKPNILYVLTDDQPVETMSVMKKTIRWFKRKGRVYDNAYVATPICCPSRAEAMTGQYAHNNRVLNNGGAVLFRNQFWMRDPFDDQRFREYEKFPWTKTVQCDLYRNGYKNAIFGKYVNGWRNTVPYNRNGAVPTCFDRQESWMGFDRFHRGTGGTTTLDVAERHPRSDDYLGRRASRFIRSQKGSDQPWFAYVALHSPHLPLAPAARYRRWQPPARLRHKQTASETPYDMRGKPAYVQNTALNTYASNPSKFDTARYALGQQRMVKSVDDTMLRLRRALTQTNQSRETVVIFTSDNGMLWGDHGLYSKFYPYKDSVHVPMMIIAPRRVGAGTKDHRLVSNIDIAPTIYDLTNIRPMFHRVDGYSMIGTHHRKWLLMESGDNGVTPYWAASISRKHHYIETGHGRSFGGAEVRTSPRVPVSSTDIGFREYYRLRNFHGSERVNLAYPDRSAVPNIGALSRRLKYAAWSGPGATPRRGGCYGTIGSRSRNPCP